MQIVIDIPDQMYLNAKADILCGGDILVKAIKNGTPLDKIRAEIEQVEYIMNEEIINHDRKDLINFVNGLNQSLAIINKYKAESEDKE